MKTGCPWALNASHPKGGGGGGVGGGGVGVGVDNFLSSNDDRTEIG